MNDAAPHDLDLATSADPSLNQSGSRRLRVDAQRNIDSLLEAAKTVFVTSSVDAPAKEIADLAGVGVGTMYRHFPRRSDLVAAVMANEIEACADAAPVLAAQNPPAEAVVKWVQQFTELVGTKRGLAAALHSNDPSLEELSDHVRRRLEPALGSLLDAARSAGAMLSDASANDVIFAVALLCQPVAGEEIGYNQRMVAVFLNGLRAGTNTSPAQQ
jgi:AcrR family transcriptional regulator